MKHVSKHNEEDVDGLFVNNYTLCIDHVVQTSSDHFNKNEVVSPVIDFLALL